MTITGMEKGYRKRIRIYVDEVFCFSLYEREIHNYQLKLNMELSRELYDQILENTVFKRGKQKALNLLKRMDYTEGELREKLKKSDFTIDIVDRVIDYINSYHYLDDTRYVNHYIAYKKSNKSIRQIKMELKRKGVDNELINQQIEEANISDKIAIQRAIAKKTKDIHSLTYEEKQKIGAYLFRKGFTESDIRQQLLL